jgi:hypothetical protein
MVAAETPAGWLPPRIIGQVVVVADPVVVGSVLVVVGPVLVVVGPVVVGSALVVVSSVVVGSVVIETAVVVGAVVVGSLEVLGAVTEGWVVAPADPRAERLLVAVVPLGTGVSAPVRRPAMVIGWLAVDGLVSWLAVGGEGAVVGSVVMLLVKEVEVGAGATVTVGWATPGAGFRGGDCGGTKVAEATRAARTAKVSPKVTSRSLQGRRGLARCRGEGFGISIVPVRLLLPDAGCPWRRPHYRAHRP